MPSCNKIQQRAIRYYLGVHRFCPIPALNGDIGWNTCLVRRKISMVRYWNRLIKMPDESITKKIFLWDYRQYNNNWCSEIENILDNVGLANLYETKSFCNIQSLQLKLRTEYQVEWEQQCKNMPKLRTYNLFKEVYETEEYFKIYLSRKQRSIVAQLRTGILPLRIETGRNENIKDPITGKMKVESSRKILSNM